LAGNPFAALQFHWVELERVVRIEGQVEKVSADESDAYFHSRPLDSRIGAWASPQSEPINGREVLVAAAAKYGAQFLLNPPRPPHWGGYRLVPERWEFWQGRKSRLHDRLRYTPAADGTWHRERLAP
jgi:pyridoxamine 5'-phosphate oxidase